MKRRILLGHLNSNGDCLFATVIARQIKEVDYPDCHLTWAVNSKCKQSVLLNPYVDEIWEIPTEKSVTTEPEWNNFVAQAENRKKRGDFDEVFLTQIIGENGMNYDGGIRSSTYNNYPHKITVPHTPIIQLSEAEVANVKRFAEQHKLARYKQVILVECGPESFTAALNLQSALELANELTTGNDQVAVILSSNKSIAARRPNVIDGSSLSFRENAELTKYCDLFIGCASGISWLTATNWAKKLPMVLIINQDNPVLPSMVYDHKYLNLPTDHIIEIKNGEDSLQKLRACLKVISLDGFDKARKIFHEQIRLTNYAFLNTQLKTTFLRKNSAQFFSCLRRAIKRNGIHIGYKVAKAALRRLMSTKARQLIHFTGRG